MLKQWNIKIIAPWLTISGGTFAPKEVWRSLKTWKLDQNFMSKTHKIGSKLPVFGCFYTTVDICLKEPFLGETLITPLKKDNIINSLPFQVFNWNQLFDIFILRNKKITILKRHHFFIFCLVSNNKIYFKLKVLKN